MTRLAKLTDSERLNEEVRRDFFEALTDFGYEDFFTPETYNKPHLLQVVTNKDRNYFGRFFSESSTIMRHTYRESGEHDGVDPQYKMVFAFASLLLGADDGKKPCHEWSTMYPEVEKIISAHGPETQAAFETLFTLCKQYQRNTQWGGDVSQEEHGMTDEQAAELDKALELIWKAYPATDPRLIEGAEHVMSSTPIFKESFPWYPWTENDSRSDYQIAKTLNGILAGDYQLTPQRVAEKTAIANQSAENITQLKPYAKEIAERILGWSLNRTLKLNEYHHGYDKGLEVAKEILGNLADGTKSIEQIAHDIQKQRYGKLLGERHWLQNDNDRTMAHASAKAMPKILSVVKSVYDGTWFDKERDAILTLSNRVAAMAPKEEMAPAP